MEQSNRYHLCSGAVYGVTNLGTDYVFSEVLQWSLHLCCVLVKASPLDPVGFYVSLRQGWKNKPKDSKELPHSEGRPSSGQSAQSFTILGHKEETMPD